MDQVIEKLNSTQQKNESAARFFDVGNLREDLELIVERALETAKAWSQSWLGYQATVYLDPIRSPLPGERFSVEWGFEDPIFNEGTRGPWREYAYDEIEAYILEGTRNPWENLELVARRAREVFGPAKDDLISILDAVLAESEDKTLSEIRELVADLTESHPADTYINAQRPSGSVISRDASAMSGGIRVPPHVHVLSRALAISSTTDQCKKLAALARRASTYLLARSELQRPTRTVTNAGDSPTGIFIGHGKSSLWLELKDFIQGRLDLTPLEFNNEPIPGISTKERLEELLNQAQFAFLIMTAEDILPDGSHRARENVVHEVGLFQGRLGFKRAIVLLEEGCNEFSNIHGVGQIRFPKGHIGAKFEEIRRVLEREGILQ